MTTTKTTPSPESVTGLNERVAVLEKKAVIFALWIFVLLNFIFRDLHEIGKAEFLEEALTGTYNGTELTEALFLLGGIMVEIPIAMTLMTWILPLRSNRWANIIIPPLWGLTLIGMAGDLDDYFHFGLMLIALAAIVWQAWNWDRSTSSAHAPGTE
ncbi:MAG: hypothetical protein EX269_14315 [Acidimicrobiales bacterium]|nr:MAG: hypothetical protein EX269_14315 [Acidimicrobiales bacterium]